MALRKIISRMPYMEESLWTLVSRTVEQSGGIEKSVFFLLLLLSLASWCVMLVKILEFRATRAHNRKFTNLFDASQTLGAAAASAKTMDATAITPRLSVFEAALSALERGAPAPKNTENTLFDPRQIPVQGATGAT